MRSKSRLTAVEPRRAAETSRQGPLRERSQGSPRNAGQRRYARDDRREAGAVDASTPPPQATTHTDRPRKNVDAHPCSPHRPSFTASVSSVLTMGAKALINSHPKKFGKGGRRCRVCGNQQAIIRKYNMNICRQCFRTYAKDIGFVKYN